MFRFSEADFRERSLEDVEEDWPLSYQELAPFYSYVERMVGVSGSREGLTAVPDGEFLMPPLKFRCSDHVVKRACDKLGLPLIPTRKALNTRAFDGRAACHYCGHCMEGCDVSAIFSVPASMFPKARVTGNFTLMANKLAREILTDDEGRARAVSVIDTVTRVEEEVRAKRFAVCCATVESARLLLNSRGPRHPNGLANSSDMVGRHLHGHVVGATYGYLEEFVGAKPSNQDGALDHTFIPRVVGDRKKRKYVGGYQFQINYVGYRYPYQAQHVRGFGARFKEQVRELQPALYQLGGYGKVMAKPENRVTVDASRPDAYGIPSPVVRFRFDENDVAIWRDFMGTAKAILEEAKVRLLFDTAPAPAGFASHEAGTARMGRSAKTSVLDPFCRTHDVPNLWVVDGSCFVTFPEKNPTLTIMALAVRAARKMTEEVRGGTTA